MNLPSCSSSNSPWQPARLRFFPTRSTSLTPRKRAHTLPSQPRPSWHLMRCFMTILPRYVYSGITSLLKKPSRPLPKRSRAVSRGKLETLKTPPSCLRKQWRCSTSSKSTRVRKPSTSPGISAGSGKLLRWSKLPGNRTVGKLPIGCFKPRCQSSRSIPSPISCWQST